jgi:NADPH-ferrihemoprotein reductase
LASKYFEDLKADFSAGKQLFLRIAFKQSNFILPYEDLAEPPNSEENKKIPIIMIGSGVGVAPFRAFLQEKECLLQKGKINKGEMEMTLFFGCKHEDGDNIFREEFKEYLEQGVLNKFYAAYSRDQVRIYFLLSR